MESFAKDQFLSSNSTHPTGPNISQSATSQKPQEPNIDLELDVKVLINSGKCVLHTKDYVKEEEIKL